MSSAVKHMTSHSPRHSPSLETVGGFFDIEEDVSRSVRSSGELRPQLTSRIPVSQENDTEYAVFVWMSFLGESTFFFPFVSIVCLLRLLGHFFENIALLPHSHRQPWRWNASSPAVARSVPQCWKCNCTVF